MVFTEPKNLQYLNTTKLLNQRQACWAEILSQFYFKIVYRPGEKHSKADVLSRLLDPELEGEGEKQDPMIHIFKAGQFQHDENAEALLTCHIMVVKASQVEESSWSKEILKAGLLVQHWLGISNALKTGQGYPALQQYGREDKLVTYERRIYCPESNALKVKIAHQYQDGKVAGHFGRDKALDLMKGNHYWPDIEEWV